MTIVCPRDSTHHEFSATAHVLEEWKVDEHGTFREVLSPSLEVSHRPQADDLFLCLACGTTALVRPN